MKTNGFPNLKKISEPSDAFGWFFAFWEAHGFCGVEFSGEGKGIICIFAP